MHKKIIEIDVFDIGDYVFTPRGSGIIIKVFEDQQSVRVQHKFGNEQNPRNLPIIMNNDVPFLISKEEYDRNDL